MVGWAFQLAAVWSLVLLFGCTGQQVPDSTNQFVSREFNFEISVPEGLLAAGWLIVRREDAAVIHDYVPPDSSSWQPVVVVIPPGRSFPSLSPFFVDIFHLRNPAMAAKELGDRRAEQAGSNLISRRSRVVSGVPAEEVISGSPENVIYETFLVHQGLGYSVNASGAPDTSSTAVPFIVSSSAYEQVIQTFRILK